MRLSSIRTYFFFQCVWSFLSKLSCNADQDDFLPPGIDIPDDDGLMLPEVIVDGFVDVEACYDALAMADADNNDEISLNEYVTFLQKYGPKGFISHVTGFSGLPLVLTSNFNILSCLCKREGLDDNCCIGQDAHLEAAGSKPNQFPNSDQTSYLFLVCSLTSIAIDRVLDSAPPSATPTFFPTNPPSDIPTGIITGPTSPPPVDMVVTTVYQIGVRDGDTNNVPFSKYEGDLISAMNSLSAQVLLDMDKTRRQLKGRQLLRSRHLQTVDGSTSVNGLIEINCPSDLTFPGDRCEEITASIVLVFQPDDADPEGVALEFQTALNEAIEDSELQDALDNANPNSLAYILNGREPGDRSRNVIPVDTGISQAGRRGLIIGAFAFVGVLVALLLARRRNDKPDKDELQPAPEEALLDSAEEPAMSTGPRKLAYDTKPVDSKPLDSKPLVGATAPDYGKRQVPNYGKQMTESDDEMDHMSDPVDAHDSSSNAGSSGWSSSAGVSSLNTGSADGMDDIVGIAAGSTLAGIAAGSGRLQSGGGDGNDPSIPSVSRTDLDSAIEAGDWAAVGATAALLAAASDSQSYSSKSQRTGATGATPSKSGSSVSSLDAARAAELDHLVDAGDWEGVVLAAAKYEAAEGTTGSRSGSVATDSDNRSGSVTGSGTYPSVDSRSSTRSKALKRQELRAQVEDLVQRVVPEEINNVDEMMLQFRGREEELVETLRTMQERAVAQKARQGAQKAAKQQAKRTVTEARAAGVVPVSAGPTTPSKADAKAGPGASSAKDGSPDSNKSGGSFPHVTATSLGTGQVTKKKPPTTEREQKQSALEQAIEAGDWEAVGEAAAMLSDASMTSADSEEIDRLAEGLPSDRSSATSREGDRAAELDDLIDKGDWTGVVAAASRYSADDKKQGAESPAGAEQKGKGWFGKQSAKEQEVEERRQRRLKRMQEEQEALAQAEIWMAIAEQSKQDTKREVPGASDAADWAIARSLTMLAQAEQAGDLEDTRRRMEGSSQTQQQQQDGGDGEEEV